MHRSGTSLAASLLEDAGLHIGERLMEGNWSNPRGHFEDMDFIEFQRGALVQLGLHQDGWLTSDLPKIPEDLLDQARALMIRKRQVNRPWGWKDPRTVLFLPLWISLIPDARFAIVYRAPWEVVESLFRRGDAIFADDPELAVKTWVFYNLKLLALERAAPERCVLANVKTITANAAAWVSALAERTGISLRAPNSAIYEKELFHGVQASDRAAVISRYYPEAMDAFASLEHHAFRPRDIGVLHDDRLRIESVATSEDDALGPCGLEALASAGDRSTEEAERRRVMRAWHRLCVASGVPRITE
jgi:hypothetical protein